MEIKSSLDLIQSYYRFLYLGLFLEDIIKENDLSEFAKDLKIQTGKNTSFTLKEQTIKKLLKEIYQNQEKQNIFGYFTQISMFRGITATVKELLETNNEFKKFLQENLKGQYFHFEQTVSFIRNILSHNTHFNMYLKQQDYKSQKIYLLERGKHQIHLNFNYHKLFPKYRTGSKSYGYSIKINFKKLNPGDNFFDIVSIHQLFLLSESCYNMIEIYKSSSKAG
ncbi:hypothetical protein [Candidatus Absconditicoccus praedator]|uniref:hypothetical protein n=1 Tax=Candidatus Absconditicoccus praedator TaxID=2735562 RepID=UPI001E3B8260|nr:hypothetical protein [Candidatus Absconditicoccus praedator]UFX83361.1 hypothetical protein HLG78_04500 [Candidatus Absconditicoccus praedator]